jgi:hypothetical protein
MSEPRLSDIDDYNTLKGEKRKVVWAVILTGLLMGILYMFVYNKYNNKEDTIEVNQTIKNIPMQ